MATELVTKIAKAWVKREKALGYKPGKRTDALAVEFAVGAMAAVGETEADPGNLTGFAAMMVATRGAGELRRIAKEAEAKEAA